MGAWWLREGIEPQVVAFRRGVNDVCASSAVWAFEPGELCALFCGGLVEWTKDDIRQNLRRRGEVDQKEIDSLADVLVRMDQERRGRFLEFVTACPRLLPGGLATSHITVVRSHQPAGSLPRARTCVNELHMPVYETLEQLEKQLAVAVDNAEGLYDDNRMGWMG